MSATITSPNPDHFEMCLDTGNCLVEYYLTQPAATQWVAVGLARPANDGSCCDAHRRMVAGSGPTETDAIRAMLGRCAGQG
ncbi:MAG: hypothetical protein V9F06_09585 [Thermomicrobiales bacterium]|nr:hypothetical protein [Chloroflexota bacterium]